MQNNKDEEIKLEDEKDEITTIRRIDSPKIDLRSGPVKERFSILESKEAGTVKTI